MGARGERHAPVAGWNGLSADAFVSNAFARRSTGPWTFPVSWPKMSTPPNDDDDVSEATRLDVFCSRQDDAWRAYVWPGWQPRSLRQHLDDEGEAFPAHFDFDDLEDHMRDHGATLQRTECANGDVQLVAQGASAQALALWLSGVFGTGMRVRGSEPGDTR